MPEDTHPLLNVTPMQTKLPRDALMRAWGEKIYIESCVHFTSFVFVFVAVTLEDNVTKTPEITIFISYFLEYTVTTL